MNTKESTRVKTGVQQGRDDERGVKPACDRDPPRRSVEILRDLGLSKEKIVAYHRRFPTPTPRAVGTNRRLLRLIGEEPAPPSKFPGTKAQPTNRCHQVRRR